MVVKVSGFASESVVLFVLFFCWSYLFYSFVDVCSCDFVCGQIGSYIILFCVSILLLLFDLNSVCDEACPL